VTIRDKRRRMKWLAIGLLGCASLLLPGAAAGATTSGNPCPRHLDDGTIGAPVSPPIALTAAPGSTQRIINFGTGRATKIVKRLVFTADKPLPDLLNPQELNLDALISRAGDTLESTDFPDPTFSQPRISEDRQSITFAVCLSPGSIPPGKYVGGVTLSGPPGLGASSVSLTINAKVATLFYGGALAALLGALALLVLKDAAAFKNKEANKNTHWPEAFKHPLKDPLWWATTLVALITAFGTLYAVYAANPAWGAGGFSDTAALIGAAFAAIGGHTIISTLTPS